MYISVGYKGGNELMRILISIYSGGPDFGSGEKLFSRLVSTELSPFEVMKYIGLCEYYDSRLIVGQTLSFWDMNCYSESLSQMVLQLEKLPSCTLQETKPIAPTFLRADTEYPLAADYIKRAKYQSPFLRGTRKYEFGANSWDAVTFWMSVHPFEMIFVGGFIYDVIKFLIGKVSRLLKCTPAVKL